VSIVAAAPTDYTAPGIEEFWQPLFGTDGPWAITRPMFLMAFSLILITWWLLATTRKKALVPSRGQMGTEAVYGLVRNGVAKDLIGSHEFMRFVPLLFSMFVLILGNNLFGVIPPMSYPTMSRIGFRLVFRTCAPSPCRVTPTLRGTSSAAGPSLKWTWLAQPSL